MSCQVKSSLRLFVLWISLLFNKSALGFTTLSPQWTIFTAVRSKTHLKHHILKEEPG